MPSRSYYCVIRYVPDLIRDEGINIGVALEANLNGEKIRQFHFAESFQRAAKLDPFMKGSALERTIRISIEQIMRESEVLNLEELIGNFSGGKIQFTEPRLTLVDNIEDEISDLFAQFVFDDKEERHHGKADPTLRREVREVLAQRGINGDRLTVSTHKEPIRVKGNRARHLFDMSIRVNHHEDFIRCISFDVEHYSLKLDAAKALVYDVKDIKTVNRAAEVISVLYPPKTHEGETPRELFAEAQGILKDERIPSFNFDSSEEINELVSRIKAY